MLWGVGILALGFCIGWAMHGMLARAREAIMDPNAAYELFVEAMADGRREDVYNHGSDLAGWLRKGGFEPQWTSDERDVFISWTALNLQEGEIWPG